MAGRMIFIIISALIYLGCAAKPVKVEFSAAHPANPLAQESAVIRQESEDSMGHGNMQMEQHTGHGMSKEPHQKPMKHSSDKDGHQGHN